MGLLPNMESYIEQALTFLKSNCLPENRLVDMRWILTDQYDSNGNELRTTEVKEAMTRWDIEVGLPNAINKEIKICQDKPRI